MFKNAYNLIQIYLICITADFLLPWSFSDPFDVFSQGSFHLWLRESKTSSCLVPSQAQDVQNANLFSFY